MQVNEELVSRLATLSRLHFTESEKSAIRADLERMIGFVEKLREVDTVGIEPMLSMSGLANIMREDRVTGQLSPKEALQNAPSAENGFFAVPKVINK